METTGKPGYKTVKECVTTLLRMKNSPEKSTFEPEVVVLYCQHCSSGDTDITTRSEAVSGFSVQPVMIPCSSKIEVAYLLKILERGADAVELIACPEDKCRSLVGSLRAEKRIDYARGLLEQVNISPQRLGISRKLAIPAKELMSVAANRAEAVRALGPNPIKKGVSR